MKEIVSAESRTRSLEYLRADYERVEKVTFKHFYCPMLMKDEPVDLMLGHVVNEKFASVPEFKLVQRKDIDSWYGSVFESDFLSHSRFQGKGVDDVFFGSKPPRGLRPIISAGGQEIGYYGLGDDPDTMPTDAHTLMEMNGKNGGFLRIALKRPPAEILMLQHQKWQSEVFADYRVASMVSLIKAAYLTLFWKLGYQYVLSSAGLSVGRSILGYFFLENRGKPTPQVHRAATEFFKPYVNMVRPALVSGENAPRGTIEDNRVLIWLGSSGRGIGIGVFVRTDNRLDCVLMPAYSDAKGAEVYQDFLQNDKEGLWVREGKFNEKSGEWDAHPQRVPMLWPKNTPSFDLSQTAKDILAPRPPTDINRDT